jgi:hypothetical protein
LNLWAESADFSFPRRRFASSTSNVRRYADSGFLHASDQSSSLLVVKVNCPYVMVNGVLVVDGGDHTRATRHKVEQQWKSFRRKWGSLHMSWPGLSVA